LTKAAAAAAVAGGCWLVELFSVVLWAESIFHGGIYT